MGWEVKGGDWVGRDRGKRGASMGKRVFKERRHGAKSLGWGRLSWFGGCEWRLGANQTVYIDHCTGRFQLGDDLFDSAQ